MEKRVERRAYTQKPDSQGVKKRKFFEVIVSGDEQRYGGAR